VSIGRFCGMFLVSWLQYLISEVFCSETIPLSHQIRNSGTIRIEKLSTLISRPRSFDEPLLGTPRPDSTSILSENFPIIPRTHHQCRIPSGSSAVPSQAQPTAKQQIVLFFVSDRRSTSGDPSPVTTFQMKSLSEDTDYCRHSHAGNLSNVSD
jgi:hypothetical protein